MELKRKLLCHHAMEKVNYNFLRKQILITLMRINTIRRLDKSLMIEEWERIMCQDPS